MGAIPLVMICDDDLDDQLLIKEAFEESGIKADFRFTNDGLELVHYLEDCDENSKHPCPKIVLLDLNMPRMTGKQVLAWMKSNPKYRTIPVVIYTTSNAASDVRECYGLGANSFMTKCIEFEQLVTMADAFSKYWMGVSKLP